MIACIPFPDEYKTVKHAVDTFLKENPDLTMNNIPFVDRFVYVMGQYPSAANDLTVIYFL